MIFNPYADECTTFKYVRRLRFAEESIGITVINTTGGKQLFTNSKPFVIYYDLNTSNILNTLQVVKLKSEKIKVKHSLDDLIAISDIQKSLKGWVKEQYGKDAGKVLAFR